MNIIKSLVIALSLATAGTVSAKTINITIGHVDAQEWTTSKKGAATQVFKNLVEAESGGRMKVNIYPAGQLARKLS